MISVIITTVGSEEWSDLAWSRAYPSVSEQDAQVIVEHHVGMKIEAARNLAARNATGEWLCFLDADDELDPGYVEAMADSILATEAEPLLHAPRVSWVEQTLEGMSLASEPEFPNQHAPWPKINHCVIGTVVHADMFQEVGGFKEEYWPWSDYELWLRCCAAGARVEYVRDAVYVAHVNPESDNRRITLREGQRLGRRIMAEHRARLAQH